MKIINKIKAIGAYSADLWTLMCRKNSVVICLISLAAMFVMAGCDDNESNLQLDGDCMVTDFELDGRFKGIVDRADRTVTVSVPEVYDTEEMEVTRINVSEGAVASMKVGDVMNFSFPQAVTVTNGSAMLDFTVKVKHDEAKITSFTLNDSYVGIIDQTNRTIVVRVPSTANVKTLVPNITLSPGATVTPGSGQAVDFTNPVMFTAVYNTATTVYTVTVIPTDAPSVVYVGLANTVDELNPEEKEAAMWMLRNVANSLYVSFNDVQAGRVDLSECKLMWWHLHVDFGIDNMEKFDNAAPSAVNALVKMKNLYRNGMNFLLTRYATYYAAKLGATKDGNNPNNCWGGEETVGEIIGGAWNFFIQGHESHPLYQNLVMNSGETDKVYTCDKGYRITNSTAQWHIGADWGGYADNDIWRKTTGGIDLGYGGDGAIVAWEYPSEGDEGHILCIGSGCYDWYAHEVDTSADKYHGNVSKMTENAINYLTGN